MNQAGLFAPLRERNFRRYAAARVVNMSGTSMASVALAFAVLDESDSSIALGQVLAAHSIPLVVFLLVGGVIADRFGRARVMRVCNTGAGLAQGALALLVITGNVEHWHFMVLAAVSGTLAAATFPAMAAVMPQLVPRDQLQQANVLISMARGSLFVLGPTVAAGLVVTVGPGWALAVDAAAWLVSAAILTGVRVPVPDPHERTGFVDELREGWSLFRGTTWLWVIVLAFGALNFIHAGAWFTLGPPLAKDTIGEEGWGLVLSAEGLGLLAMTAVMARFRLERPLLIGMLGTAAFTLPLLMLGMGVPLVLLMAAAFLAGAGFELFGLAWNLAMQENIEDRMLSRAYSYDALGSYAAIPLGQLGFGVLGGFIDASTVMVAAGVAYGLIAFSTLLSPSVRGLRRAQHETIEIDTRSTSSG
ncbi:MAG TPA: MFS transporter [Actinophytocola sp.]|nr:MFS transporter [Actinophytocola sp.]